MFFWSHISHIYRYHNFKNHKIPWHVKVLIYYDMVLPQNFCRAQLVVSVGFCASEEDFVRIIYKHVTLFLSGKSGKVAWGFFGHMQSISIHRTGNSFQSRTFVSLLTSNVMLRKPTNKQALRKIKRLWKFRFWSRGWGWTEVSRDWRLFSFLSVIVTAV